MTRAREQHTQSRARGTGRAALGIHLQLDHPRFKEVVRTIAETCRKHGKLARGSAETEAQIEEYWKLGCKVLNLPGTDTSTYLDRIGICIFCL